MGKKAIVNVISSSSLENEDKIEIVSPGEYIKLEDGYKVIYVETELSGMDGTTTTITIRDKEVILEREGTIETKMYFDEDNPNVSLYSTPYGIIEITISTDSLFVDANENGAKVEIEYDMSVGGQESISTSLVLVVKTQ